MDETETNILKLKNEFQELFYNNTELKDAKSRLI